MKQDKPIGFDMDTYMNEVRRVMTRRVGVWRYGQTLFNVLYALYPTLAEQVRATRIDPFYATNKDSESITKFLEFLQGYDLPKV